MPVVEVETRAPQRPQNGRSPRIGLPQLLHATAGVATGYGSRAPVAGEPLLSRDGSDGTELTSLSGSRVAFAVPVTARPIQHDDAEDLGEERNAPCQNLGMPAGMVNRELGVSCGAGIP